MEAHNIGFPMDAGHDGLPVLLLLPTPKPGNRGQLLAHLARNPD